MLLILKISHVMSMKKNLAVIAHLILVNFNFSVFANDPFHIGDVKGTHAGQTVFNFLTIPVSASQLSKGITAFASNCDATDIPFAASATAFFNQYEFAITHLEWLMGLRKEYLGACFPFLDQGTFGIYSQVFTLGSFDYARDIDEYETEPKAAEVAVGASYARQIFYQKLSAGITLSFVESRLDGDHARGFNGVVDIMYTPLHWLNSHAYVRNFGSKITYNSTPEQQPLQLGMSLMISPFTSKDTLTLAKGKFDLNWGLGVQKVIDAPLQIGTTLEVKPVIPLHIRLGYEHYFGHQFNINGLSSGIGFDVKQYGIDAGWKFQSIDFGSVWAVTIRYHTQNIIPISAIDYYKIALRFFKKKKFKPCIQYAKKALKINPELWRAHSLISRALGEMNQKLGNDIVLIYSGNIKGQFLPLSVNNLTMGGLSRQTTAIKQLRKDYQYSVLIDAGNMITRQTPIFKAQFANRYLEMMNYDALGIGSGEISFGSKKYSSELNQASLEFICTNCSNKLGRDLIDSRIIEVGDYKIAVLTVIPPGETQKKEDETNLDASIMEVVRQTQAPKHRMCNLQILIVNDTWENVQHYAARVPKLDIILSGSLKQHFETPMIVGDKPILSVGEYGKYLGALNLRFHNRKLASFNNRLIPLTNEIAADPVIDEMAKQITLKINLEKQGISRQHLQNQKLEGIFTFLSDRRGSTQVYLKVMKTRTEFPLTFESSLCYQPILAWSNGQIVYLTEPDAYAGKRLMVMDINGENKYQFDLDGKVEEIRLTPNEQWIYAAVQGKHQKGTDIYRINPSGGEKVAVITWKNSSEKDMAFSSDNINMAFLSDRDGTPQVYLSDLYGNTPICLTDNQSYHEQPGFSPLDKYISYLSTEDNLGDKYDLWVLERNTGKKIRVTRNAGVRDYCWLDDEGTILYSSGINLVDLNVINLFSQENTKLITSTKPKTYSERKPTLIWYRNQKYILYVREYAKGERKLFLVDENGSNDRPITFNKGNCWLE